MAGYRPLQDPPGADLTRAQRLLGCFRAVLSVELDPVVSKGLGWVLWGLPQALSPSRPSLLVSPTHQEGRLVEKESSEWQVQGQPTVLLTLAHIFHRFAPLLVRAPATQRGKAWPVTRGLRLRMPGQLLWLECESHQLTMSTLGAAPGVLG